MLPLVSSDYGNVDGTRNIMSWLKVTLTVVGATVFKCGFRDGDVVILIPVLETFAILVVDYLVGIPILPNMAPDEEGLTLCHHIRRDL